MSNNRQFICAHMSAAQRCDKGAFTNTSSPKNSEERQTNIKYRLSIIIWSVHLNEASISSHQKIRSNDWNQQTPEDYSPTACNRIVRSSGLEEQLVSEACRGTTVTIAQVNVQFLRKVLLDQHTYGFHQLLRTLIEVIAVTHLHQVCPSLGLDIFSAIPIVQGNFFHAMHHVESESTTGLEQ